MNCYNRNTSEYQAIYAKHKSYLKTDMLIDEYQIVNKTDAIPTIDQLNQLVKNQKIQFNLKRKNVKKTILANLRNKGYIHKRNGEWWIVSNKQLGYNKYEYDSATFRANAERIRMFMKIWNIPREALDVEFGTRRKYRAYSKDHPSLAASEMIQWGKITFNENALTMEDTLPEMRNENTTHINSILDHLKMVFPQIGIDIVSIDEAKDHYESLPASQQKVPFAQIRSYIVDGRAKIIDGRVTVDIAIEEVLHPFINALMEDNPALFQALLKEAEKNFPALALEIFETYNKKRGFTEKDYMNELVTQALSRHFRKEKETTTTEGWKAKIAELLKWLLKHISNIYQYATKKKLVLYPGMIDSTTTMTDLAKLLNTGDLQFNLKEKHIKNEGRIQFKLSPRKQAQVDKWIEQGTAEQANTIKLMTHQITRKDTKEEDSNSVNPLDGSDSPVVILDKGQNGKKHVYRDIPTGEEYPSVTSLIGGEFVQEYPIGPNETIQDIESAHGVTIEELMIANKMSREQLTNLKVDNKRLTRIQIPKGDQYAINREIGNDFDFIVEGLAEGLSWEEVKEMIEEKARSEETKPFQRVSEEQARDFFNQIKVQLPTLVGKNSIIIPQVVLANKINTGKVDAKGDPIYVKLAGSIDLMVINTDGSVFPIDLKTSWTSIHDPGYTKPYPVGPGSILYDPNKSQSQQKTLSKKQKHGIQVNLYQRLLENSGHDIFSKNTNAENLPMTLHYTIKLNKDETAIESYSYDDVGSHPYGSYDYFVDQILPFNVDTVRKRQQRSEGNPVAEDDFIDSRTIKEENIIANDTYQAIFEVMDHFQQGLISRRKAIDRLKNSLKLMGEKAGEIEKIDFTISAITLAMRDAKVDVLYTELLRDAIEQLDIFLEYIDPAKGNSIQPEFISKVVNFQKTLEGFQGLTKLTKNEGLNNEQLKLKDTLSTRINEIAHGADSKINLSIDDYVRTLIRNESSRDFDNHDLDILMTRAEDIGMTLFYTGDMSTQRDTILALMDKIYKRQRQKVLDATMLRNYEIKKAATKLEKLTGKKVDYSFMLVYDENDLFTGRYVQKIGSKYYSKHQKLREALTDPEGTWKEYQYNSDTSWYGTAEGQEAIKLNKEIHAARQNLRKFMEAETIVDGVPQDGNNHMYNEEFKTAREKYQIFKPYKGGNYGVWVKKDGISKEEYQQFLLKYYDTSDYQRGIYDNEGNFTGMVQPDSGYFPKREFVEIRSQAGDGTNMVDPKYAKLMLRDVSQMTELEKAQKEFYDIYIKHFEGPDGLLNKLPPSIRDQMLGRVPTTKDAFYNDMKKKGPFFVRLWAKMKRSIKNFVQTTAIARKVVTDENGRILDSLPIYMVGRPRTEAQLTAIEDSINKLDVDYKKLDDPKPKDEDAYRRKRGELIEQRMQIQTRPTVNELSTDIADSLMRFSYMAENYEIMGEIEDTLHAMLKVIKQRQYTPESGGVLKSLIGGVEKIVGRRADDDLEDPLIVQRAKKWMKMVYYDNDKTTKTMVDKLADTLISYTSLTYVGFNPFGNFNNYMVGRMSNLIETAGGMYYKPKSAVRATMEFNKRALPDIIKRMGHKTFLTEKLGLTKGQYEDYIPESKYEALVAHFRMMDAKADIRETLGTVGKESTFERMKGWGYVLQDAAEYNVQTKVGMAILMSTRAMKLDQAGNIIEDMALYDALQNDPKTGEVKMKEGFTHIQTFKNGVLQTRKNDKGEEVPRLTKWNDNTRYDIRNNIREVNKQIHGNYAYEDRAIMQTMALGRLAMQFHKWVAPTIKARFRPEYYDENLGWVEGRYRTGWSFMKYAVTNLNQGRNILTNWKAQQGVKGEYRVRNLKRNIGDIAIVMASIILKIILTSAFKGEGGDDEESKIQTRLENALLYQLDRQKQEFMLFWPVLGAPELFKMSKSPFSSLRTMEELTEAMAYTLNTIKLGIKLDKGEFLADSRVVYQRGDRAGQWKISKNWKDAMPLLYSFEKWDKYMTHNTFEVK